MKAILKYILITVLTIIAYVIAGHLALKLAIPSGSASPIWPAAGIALGVVILYGKRYIPAVIIASFLVNAWLIHVSIDGLSSSGWWIAVLVGVGAGLQVLWAHFLLQCCIGWPNPLTRARNIMLFGLIVGPVGSVVNPIVSAITLWWFGYLNSGAIVNNVLTWWVGDIIGVLIFVPMVLIVFSRGKQIWRRRRLTVFLPLLVLFIAVIVFFYFAKEAERSRLKLQFDVQATSMSAKLQDSIEEVGDALKALQAFYDSSGYVERAEFKQYTQHIMQGNPSIQALEWIPLVTSKKRHVFVQRARNDGYHDFQITQRDADGRLVVATDRKQYFPVYYVEPYKGNEKALGFDLASNPARRLALDESALTKEVVSTAAIKLVQVNPSQSAVGVLLFSPVFKQQQLQGFMLVVLRMHAFVQHSLDRHFQRDFNIYLTDTTKSDAHQVLYQNNSKTLQQFTKKKWR